MQISYLRRVISTSLVLGALLATPITVGAPNDSVPEHFLLQFLDKKKLVWLFFDKSAGTPKFDGDLNYETFTKPRQVHYVIAGSGAIRYKDTVITVTPKDVLINGIAMEAETNAVVDQQNHVRMGAFIRTFK